MHVRLSMINGASDIDRGIEFLGSEVVPQLQQQKGFRGLNASGNRETHEVSILTMWDSPADLDASESMADKARTDAVKVIGGEVTVERYEQLVWELGTVPPAPGAKLHIRHIRMEPSKVDDNADYFRQDVLPQIKSTPGFLGVRLLMDRATGQGRVGTMWADDESRQGSLARAEQRRATAQSHGVEFGREQFLDVLFATPMKP